MTVSNSNQIWAADYHEVGHAVTTIHLKLGVILEGLNGASC
jgi:hypothetical protein